MSHKIGYTCTYIHVYIALFSFQFIGKQAKFENIWIITTYHCVRLERRCLFIHFLTCEWGDGWWRGKGVLTRMKLLIFTNFYNRILQIFYLKDKSFSTLLLCCKLNKLPWVGGGCFIQMYLPPPIINWKFTPRQYIPVKIKYDNSILIWGDWTFTIVTS